MSREPKVNFLIIGVQKGGTTSANHHISQNPQIWMPSRELHFFDKHHNYANGRGYYEALFKNTTKPIRGEKTPSYVYLRYAIDRIKAYNPDMKLVLFLRDPVKRAFSQWNMKRTTKTFRKFYTQDESHTLKSISQLDPAGHATQRGFYMEQINYILTQFPREQLHIVISEEVLADPLGEYNKIFDFLGAPRLEKIAFSTEHNKGKYDTVLSDEDRQYLTALYKPHNEALFEFLGRRIPQWL